jgi:CRISPR/Cas system CSM-associated protein Csm3 (group 7 of RAMP superfamily)
MAGKIHISDLCILENKKDKTRDGIAIDRNTGTTKNGAKFDYNILEDVNFKLEIILENLEDYELDLINIGLNMVKNDIFGGKTSRGIGKSNLSIDNVYYVEKDNLKDYLFKGKMKEVTQEVLEKNKITL